jgi:hypothetical protein
MNADFVFYQRRSAFIRVPKLFPLNLLI